MVNIPPWIESVLPGISINSIKSSRQERRTECRKTGPGPLNSKHTALNREDEFPSLFRTVIVIEKLYDVRIPEPEWVRYRVIINQINEEFKISGEPDLIWIHHVSPGKLGL